MMKASKKRNASKAGLFLLLLALVVCLSSCQKTESSDHNPNLTYAIGDIYPHLGTPIGVVFRLMDDTGEHGWIIHLDRMYLPWAINYGITSATDPDDGRTNMQTIKNLDSTYLAYPSFRWCSTTWTGSMTWYLPAINELKALSDHIDLVDAALSSIPGVEPIDNILLMSSTEMNAEEVYAISPNDGGLILSLYKSGGETVAIANF